MQLPLSHAFFTASDFGILFNQTSYTVVVDHTLALTGIPLVPFTVYFSESVASSSTWSSFLIGIGGVSMQLFSLQQAHLFPAGFEYPVVDSDAITAATGDNAPEPGNYGYILHVSVVYGFFPIISKIKTAKVNITLTETPSE